MMPFDMKTVSMERLKNGDVIVTVRNGGTAKEDVVFTLTNACQSVAIVINVNSIDYHGVGF